MITNPEDEANTGGFPGSIPEVDIPERNPLTDPQAGDIIEYLPHNFRHVIGRGVRGEVLYASRCGNQWFGCTFRDKIEDWITAVDRGRVTHVGGGAK